MIKSTDDIVRAARERLASMIDQELCDLGTSGGWYDVNGHRDYIRSLQSIRVLPARNIPDAVVAMGADSYACSAVLDIDTGDDYATIYQRTKRDQYGHVQHYGPAMLRWNHRDQHTGAHK